MKYTAEIVAAAVAFANNAAEQAAIEFRAKYPEDMGDCGFATPIANGLGRKRKLRALLEAEGVRLSDWDGGKWALSVPMPNIGYNQQWRYYYETVRQAWMDALFPALELDGYLHSWAD